MKQLLSILFVLITLKVAAQSTGATVSPTTKFQQYNKALFATGQRSLDGKFKYTDTLHFVERAFRTIAEANGYIPSVQRTSGQTVLINTGGTLNMTTGVIAGGYNEDYEYKHGILDADLQLKVSVTGIFEPKTNGNVWFPFYAGTGERLLTVTSGGLMNTVTQLPTTTTVTTQSPGNATTLPASTGFVMAALGASVDTTSIVSAGGGIQIIKSIVNTPTKVWTYRTFVPGVNSTPRLIGDTTIAFDLTFANAAGPVTMQRSSYGDVLVLSGPGDTAQIAIGTSPGLGNPAIFSNSRLEVRAASGHDLFLGGDHIHMAGPVNVTRIGSGATSIATQTNSQDLVWENSLWRPGPDTQYFNYNGFLSRASTTIAGKSSLVAVLKGVTNPNLGFGYDAFEMSSDSTYKLNMFNKGGSTDSAVNITVPGLLKKTSVNALNKSVPITASTYTVAAGIYTVLCNYPGGVMVVTLPTSFEKDTRITIKNFSATSVTVTPVRAGESTSITQYKSFVYHWDGTDWFVVQKAE